MATAMGLMIFIRAPIMAVWAVAKIAGKNWEWSMATAVAVIVVLTTIGILMVYVLPRFRKTGT